MKSFIKTTEKMSDKCTLPLLARWIGSRCWSSIWLVIALSCFFLVKETNAQSTTHQSWLSIETNTTPLIFGGYALGVNIRPTPLNHWSILLGQAGHADFPDWVVDVFRPQNSGKRFDWRVDRARVIAVDYFVRSNGEGWYFGQFNFFFKNHISRDGENVTLTTHIPMIRAGYRWLPFNFGYLYLSPWVGIGSEYKISGRSSIEEVEWQMTRFHYFASINLGISFY